MTYEVEITDLRDSADAARSAATQLGTLTPGSHLTAAGTGIPGAASVAVMSRVSASWTTELSDWVKAARGYGRTLDSNATQYELDDAAARDAFGPLGGTP
ncbi:hypothetical protein [Knoellia aerolata]|uniref:Excreted virulence factor EspC, type VII ESX diderm n=1 Tax=Knoellia aerolata DSM 18566 TaxID=1385519 RepID=A0A0A0K4C2_9MICO|nr:hypothetical protein [Knoellia aerolata]KGN43127.1 hypothetical protein N801_05040 [Knoellia aerolata DSM 18566]